MRILITGATGYIGRRLVERLERDVQNRIWCVNRNPRSSLPARVTQIAGSLANKGWTKALPSDIELVIHLAQSAHYREFPAEVDDIFRVNVEATLELAEWARQAGARRFMLASTGNVYGHSTNESTELDPIDPRSMYAASKACAEFLLRPYTEHFEVLAMRLFGVYGPQQTNMLFPRLISRLASGDEITLAGGMGLRINPIYIDDCIELIRELMHTALTNRHEILNIGGNETVELSSIVRDLESLTGRHAVTRVTQDAPTFLVGSIRKLCALTEYRHFTPLFEGLRRTVLANGNPNEKS